MRYSIREVIIDDRPAWRVWDSESGKFTMGSYRGKADAQYAIDYAFTDRPNPAARIAELEAALHDAIARMRADNHDVSDYEKLLST